MQQRTLILLAVALVIVLGLVYFMGGSDPTPAVEEAPAEETEGGDGGTGG